MKRYILLTLLLVTSICHGATRNTFTKEVEQLVNSFKLNKGFNGAVYIANTKEKLVDIYAGTFNNSPSESLQKKHVFSTGSVSKEFTTIAIMMLEHEGKLNYNDKVELFLPDFPSWTKKVTIEHLMTHTSGLPKVKWKTNLVSSDVKSQLLALKTTNFEPGSNYLYTNTNVYLRALIVEQITGNSFKSFLQQRILDPLNMTSTFLQLELPSKHKNIVSGDYTTGVNGITIYSTPADLFKFDQGLRQGVLIPFESIKAKLTGDRLSGKKNRASFDFGRFYQNKNGRLNQWEHDGSNPSHHVIKFHDFEKELSIVLMSSDGKKQSLYELRSEILALYNKR